MQVFLGSREGSPYAPSVTAGPMTLLYDGDCRFCVRSARAIERRFGTARVALRNFQQPGVLAAYPAVTHEAAMRRMHAVMPDGRVFAGAEAFARILMSARLIGWLGWVYYVPGLRQVADLGYWVIAKARYRLRGKAGDCQGGTCHLHRA